MTTDDLYTWVQKMLEKTCTQMLEDPDAAKIRKQNEEARLRIQRQMRRTENICFALIFVILLVAIWTR